MESRSTIAIFSAAAAGIVSTPQPQWHAHGYRMCMAAGASLRRQRICDFGL